MSARYEIERATRAGTEFYSAVKVLLPQLNPDAKLPTRSHVRRMVSSDVNSVFVARKNGTIVGMATLVLTPAVEGLRAFIQGLVVDKNERGKGLSKKLVEACLARAQMRGARAVDMVVLDSNEAVIGLAKSLKFKTGPYSVYWVEKK